MDQIGNGIQPEPAHHRSANFLNFQKLKKKFRVGAPNARSVGEPETQLFFYLALSKNLNQKKKKNGVFFFQGLGWGGGGGGRL